MRFEKAHVPVGFAWSSPFARWQGALAEVDSLDRAVDVARAAFEKRGFSAEELTGLVFGWTVRRKEIFYGAPEVTGPMISQACATAEGGDSTKKLTG